MSSRIIKESSRKGENSEGGNRETVTGSENSDSFNSDEEDSEEERFFAEVVNCIFCFVLFGDTIYPRRVLFDLLIYLKTPLKTYLLYSSVFFLRLSIFSVVTL